MAYKLAVLSQDFSLQVIHKTGELGVTTEMLLGMGQC